MTLALADPASGTELELFNAQFYNDDFQGQVDASPLTGSDSDETFLTSLEQGGEATIQGAATGLRLSRQSQYSNDPETALGEFVATLDEFVNGAPGNGYELRRDYRSETIDGVPETVQWTARGGEPYEFGYSISFTKGDAVGLTSSTARQSASPGGDIVIAGRLIPTFREFQSSKQQPLEVTRRSFSDSPQENDITTSGGATRRVRVVGDFAGDATARNNFRDDLTDSIGQDTLVDVTDPFTGRTYTGMITSFEDTDEAGLSRLGEFGIEVIEGTT